LNHRSPGSKPGRDDQAPLHAGFGAHGRTRTCTFLIRNQELYPVEPRVRFWCRDGDLNSGLPVEGRRVLATRRSRRIGSPTRIRTWIDRLTTGRPAVGRSGNGGAPRTRTELNLRAREIRGPCACPDWFAPRGPDPSAPLGVRSGGEKGLTPRMGDMVPGVGFEPTSPRFQRGAFTRSASQANWCGRRESNPDLKSGALALCRRAAPAWWGMGRVERLAARDGVYSAATGPPVLIGIPRSWLQVAESNRAQNGL
jgi:hypothetical protein